MKILSKRAREKKQQALRDDAVFIYREFKPFTLLPLAETIEIKRKEIEAAVPELSNRFRLIRYLNWTDEDILENERLLKEELSA